jgi:hypothetical protein
MNKYNKFIYTTKDIVDHHCCCRIKATIKSNIASGADSTIQKNVNKYCKN